MPIASIVARKEILDHYGEIDLSYIKSCKVTFNAVNDMRETQYFQIYMFLITSLTPKARNTINLQQSDFINGNECSGIFLLKVIVYKTQVDSQYIINLLLTKLTTGMPDLMVSLEKNTAYLNKYIRSIGTALHARWK